MAIQTRLSTKTLWRINISLGVVVVLLALAVWNLRKSKAEHLIPSNALAVMKYSDSTALASSLPFFKDGRSFFQSMIMTLKPEYRALFNSSEVQLSLHKESKTDLGFLLYLSQNSELTQQLKSVLLKGHENPLKRFEQAYKGTMIHQVRDLNGDYLYGIIDKKEHLIISKSNLLLELYIDEQAKPKPSKFGWSLKGDSVFKNLQFNSGNLRLVSDLFPKELSRNLLSFLQQAMPLNPEFLFTENDSVATGHLIGKRVKRDAFLNVFSGQNSQDSSAARIVSPNASLILRMNLSDPQTYFKKYRAYLIKTEDEIIHYSDSLQTFLEFDQNELVKHLDGRFLYQEMEGQNDLKPRKILVLGSKSAVILEDYLKGIAARSRKLRVSKSPLRFAFGEKNIYDLNVPEFPKYLLNHMFGGFEEVLFTRKDSSLIFANDRLSLIEYMVQLDEQKNYGLTGMNRKAVLEAYISPGKTWKQLYNSVPHEWQQKLTKHEATYKQMHSILLSFESDKTLGKVQILKSKNFKDFAGEAWKENESFPIQAKQFLDLDIDRLLYLSKDKKLGVIDKKSRRISFEKYSRIGSLEKFRFYDFLQNGRPEVLVQDDQKIFLLSLNSQSQLAERAIVNHPVSIVAFDVSEKGIYFVDALGNLFFYDRSTFETTEITLDKRPLSPIQVIVTEKQGVEKVLILSDNGSLHQYFVSSGVSVEGFPRVLVTSKPAAMIYENSYGNEEVQILTEQGLLKTWSITRRENLGEERQLERGRGFLKFEVIWNQRKTDWLMIRRSKDDILILDKSGRVILQVEQPYGVPIEFSWFYDTNDNKFLCIFDGQKNQIYNLKGESIGTQKIDAAGPPFLYPDMNQLILLNPTKKQLETWTIQSK